LLAVIDGLIGKIKRDNSRTHYDRDQFKTVLNEDARQEIAHLKDERTKLERMIAGA
jgi:hypothetical protein